MYYVSYCTAKLTHLNYRGILYQVSLRYVYNRSKFQSCTCTESFLDVFAIIFSCVTLQDLQLNYAFRNTYTHQCTQILFPCSICCMLVLEILNAIFLMHAQRSTTTTPTKQCTSDNEAESFYNPANPLVIWICKSKVWTPFE